MTKDQIIKELKVQFAALQELQKKNKNVLQYLPMELKTVIATAKQELNQSLSSTEDKPKGKKKRSKCEEMEANWEKYIIEPFTKDAYTVLDKSKSPQDELSNLAANYYKKYGKKRWFDPNIQKQGSHAQHYIEVAPINRTITLHRDMVEGSTPPVEISSNYGGAIGKTQDVQVGMTDIIEISVPSNTPNVLVLGGNLTYTLDNLQVPDTFVLLDNGQQFYNNRITRKVENIVVPFSNLNGNLFIDVQESTSFSIWEAEIKLTFLQVTFKVPNCLDNDIPCPDNSTPSPRKKTGKTPCPKF